ncbi:MAG: hypothetical protein B6245_07285 [Desulfobacteraceae bacterium 4572_88]|nr:MAG: hypothetical protein B6245_07285 [Desulfobacteraceae bacterium 4572_88]
MKNDYHTFHIPVMGLGYSADTPIRVAHLGITSVISITDDIVLEPIRKYYSEKFGLPYSEIPNREADGRAKRITAYLNTVRKIVEMKTADMKKQSFSEDSDKRKYFELLPEGSSLRAEYDRLLNMEPGSEKDALEESLTSKMQAGSVDVNIMVKLDSINYDKDGNPLGSEFSDAKAALRGYANSDLRSGIVFSAGFNQSLFNYLPEFQDFYRDETGDVKKRIILKVSDFRSALVQSKVLAKKGLEVHEFRVESGLNCGGHAFPSNGNLLPSLLREFKEKRDTLASKFQRPIQKYYKQMGWEYPESALSRHPLITVQGGIGTHGEMLRLREDFGMDLTGWATPFLLVPEVTCVDASTRELLRQAGEKELYLSDASPFGIPFNNLRNTGSETWTRKMAEKGNPGSSCPKRFLISNTEFSEKPICLASRQYQKKKLAEIDNMRGSNAEKKRLRRKVLEKVCLCTHLANSALNALGITNGEDAPQSMCPSPNMAWFDRYYTLREMVDHIYGRGPCLVPSERPHMFAKEITMYVDYYEKQIKACAYTPREVKTLREYKDNLEEGMAFCLEIAQRTPYEGENLASVQDCVRKQKKRLESLCSDFEKKRSKLQGSEENQAIGNLVPSLT